MTVKKYVAKGNLLMPENINKVVDDLLTVKKYVAKRDGVKINESGLVEKTIALAECVHQEITTFYQRQKEMFEELHILSRRISNLESTKDPEIISITQEDINDAVAKAMKAYEKKEQLPKATKKKWFK